MKQNTQPIQVSDIVEAFNSCSQKQLEKDIPKVPLYVEYAMRLKRLGFVENKKVKELDQINEALDKRKTIEYYQKKYPNNNFIPEENFKELCKEFDLMFFPIHVHGGDVPEKTLDDIEKFEAKGDLECLRTKIIGLINNTFMDNAGGITLKKHRLFLEFPIILQPVRHGYLIVSI